MFERNRIDRPTEADKAVHHVALQLADNSEITGRAFLPHGRTLFDDLNAGGGFIEIETYAGERMIINKSVVRSARALNVPKADQLMRRLRQTDTFDPKIVLQLGEDADRDTVRASYHRLAKLYHPDRYAMLELPTEVQDYISAMSVRLNAAYAALHDLPRPLQPSTERSAGR